MEKLLLSETETSREFGVPTKTLQYWRYSGHADGPPFIKVGRRVYYRSSDLMRWVEEAPAYRSAFEAKTAKELGGAQKNASS